MVWAKLIGCFNATLSSSLEKRPAFEMHSLSLFRIVVSAPRVSFLQTCRTQNNDAPRRHTRLAALRPFLKLIRPESRYVYVCGNVPTPVAICNILLRFFFITSRPGSLAFSYSFSRPRWNWVPPSWSEKTRRKNKKPKWGWMRTKRRRKAPRCCGPTKNIKWYTLRALFSTFLRSASGQQRLTDDAIGFRINGVAGHSEKDVSSRDSCANLKIPETLRLQDIVFTRSVQFLSRKKKENRFVELLLFCTMRMSHLQLLCVRIIFREKCKIRINIREYSYARKNVYT